MSAGDGMTCRELVEVVSDYLEGRLSPVYTRRLEEHLLVCPYCVEYIAQMRRTIAALGELTEDSISPESRGALLEAFRGWRDR
jgi:anti-sigma factor RsiW